MRLNLSVNLAPLKAAALADIERQAEDIRGKFITLGAGQAMVYAQKEKEAEMVAANPSIDPQLVPHIANEAAQDGVTILEQAAAVLFMANLWQQASALIEPKRLAQKELVKQATTPGEIAAARNIDWFQLLAGFLQYMSP